MVSEPDNSEVKTYYGVTNSVGGMSLRDYFAAAAFQGFASNMDYMGAANKIACEINVSTASLLAKSAYKQADAMLKERSK